MKDGELNRKTQPILLNPEIIATVTTGELKSDAIHLVGKTKTEQVTFIQYRNNSGTFVEETLEQVAEKVSQG